MEATNERRTLKTLTNNSIIQCVMFVKQYVHGNVAPLFHHHFGHISDLCAVERANKSGSLFCLEKVGHRTDRSFVGLQNLQPDYVTDKQQRQGAPFSIQQRHAAAAPTSTESERLSTDAAETAPRESKPRSATRTNGCLTQHYTQRILHL